MWDLCDVGAEVTEFSLGAAGAQSSPPPSSSSSSPIAAGDRTLYTPCEESGVDSLFKKIEVSEETCRQFTGELDDLIAILTDISSAHGGVTGKTNSLMFNCENLLEQQHNLQATAQALKAMLAPFDDIEDIAGILGIPVDARGLLAPPPVGAGAGMRDPRSPEFQSALVRLSKALSFLSDNNDFLDSVRYHRWLLQLQNRAVSLVARAMKDLLDNASKICIESLAKSGSLAAAKKKPSIAAAGDMAGDHPLEASPVYQKFRGLGFRMRELSSLLQISNCPQPSSKRPRPFSKEGISSEDFRQDDDKVVRSVSDVLREVKSSYVQVRVGLLLPLLNTSVISHQLSDTDKSSGGPGGRRLCSSIRHSFSLVLRIAQLEHQLADTLFNASEDVVRHSGAPSPAQSPRGPAVAGTTGAEEEYSETKRIVEAISNAANDSMRPLIIHENDVDELCRVVTTLAEDVRAQILATPAPRQIVLQLLRGLDRTVSDTQERLVYCAELRLRQDVQLFQPLPSQLAYPDLLEKFAEQQQKEQQQQQQSDGSTVVAATAYDRVSGTWYPPLHQTLALLSKLYGVVDMSVFEDFARRSVEVCVLALRAGSDGVKRSRSPLHGDLFLVRHLLVLREQLIPFEVNLQSVQRHMDFKSTGAALNVLARNPRSLMRFDVANGLLQFAWEGLPSMQEMQQDAKKEFDSVLKTACLNLKQSVVKMILGPLDVFLTKVVAFAGDIPLGDSGSLDVLQGPLGSFVEDAPVVRLPAEARASLKSQAFMKPERIKDMLDSVQQLAAQAAPDLRDLMQLYVENSVARTILLRPVQIEVAASKRRMECVIASCVDFDQTKRDLVMLLHGVVGSLLATLTQA